MPRSRPTPAIEVDAAFVIALNARIARSGALHPGRLRTTEQPIGVTTAHGRHEPPAVSVEDLEQLIGASTAGKAPADAAIALFVELARAQPFMDGNKRTGVTMGSYLLSTFGYEVEATQQELEDFGVDVARGMLDLEKIPRWFGDHTGRV